MYPVLKKIAARGSTLVKVVGSAHVMATKLVQPLKQLLPSVATPLGMVIEVKLVQFKKQSTFKVANAAGSVILFKVEQPLKQPIPKLLMLSENVMVAKLVQLRKQTNGRRVNELGRVTVASAVQSRKQPFGRLVMVLGIIIAVKFVLPLNGNPASIAVTEYEVPKYSMEDNMVISPLILL